MPAITTYDLATGALGAIRTGPTIELMTLDLAEGRGWVEGTWPAETYAVDLETGEIVERPPE